MLCEASLLDPNVPESGNISLTGSESNFPLVEVLQSYADGHTSFLA